MQSAQQRPQYDVREASISDSFSAEPGYLAAVPAPVNADDTMSTERSECNRFFLITKGVMSGVARMW
jgi:hypothetical protein